MSNSRSGIKDDDIVQDLIRNYVTLALAVGEPMNEVARLLNRSASTISRIARIPEYRYLIEKMRESLLDTEHGILRPDSEQLPVTLNALSTINTTSALADCILRIHAHKGFFEPSMLHALRNTIKSQIGMPLDPSYYPAPGDPEADIG